MISVADGSSDATRKATFGSSVELLEAALALPVATPKAAGQIRPAWLVSRWWPRAGFGEDGTDPASASTSAPGVAPAVQDGRP